MSKILFNDQVEISDYGTPYFIAEMNTSHFGKMDVAVKMIEEAARVGADCVKFQSWSADTLYSNSYYKDNPIAKRFVNKFSLSSDQQKELALYCKSINVSFASTPYSNAEVDFLLQECDVPFIKIASMEITNLPYLKYIGESGTSIILSTGMADYDEISRAVDVISSTGNNKISVLHCVSIYPSPPEIINLNNIHLLRDKLNGFPIGYSDHTLGIEASIAAVALGAPIIEKHFTLDNSIIGMDNQMAMCPDDMERMISSCKATHLALGSNERVVHEDEMAQRLNMRRSVITRTALSAGHVITADDLSFKRPGTGISPADTSLVLGKVLLRDLGEDETIGLSDLG